MGEFQSPKIGSVVSNNVKFKYHNCSQRVFQSPKIGSVVSNRLASQWKTTEAESGFNPLKSGQLFQIRVLSSSRRSRTQRGFNPLKSGQLFQIFTANGMSTTLEMFQTPKIGSVVSNDQLV